MRHMLLSMEAGTQLPQWMVHADMATSTARVMVQIEQHSAPYYSTTAQFVEDATKSSVRTIPSGATLKIHLCLLLLQSYALQNTYFRMTMEVGATFRESTLICHSRRSLKSLFGVQALSLFSIEECHAKNKEVCVSPSTATPGLISCWSVMWVAWATYLMFQLKAARRVGLA
ncbi:hypothetical protein O6H91_17G047800 [Diphasiastrum complanatum]|uniref:Uncharacterized protein n=1 Tax=Diphasiastrum complanatum TaxID=34168 RepID=A0ACC2B6H3_DIPCM|nr:hypothetical protein O6H91_17G047800 [Diphasiastrum complanatum]